MKTVSKFFRSLFDSKPAAARRPRSVKLGFDTLEDRMVPSASSPNIHAVFEPATGNTATFFHVQDNGTAALIENTGPGAFQQLAPAGAVTDFSAGLDPTGHAALFAHMNGVMQEWTQSTGWTQLHEPVQMTHFAAVNGELYSVDNSGSLWEFTPAHTATYFNSRTHQLIHVNVPAKWTDILPNASFITIDAVTSHGQDIVVGMNGYRQLSWFLPSTGYLDSFSGSVNTFSVGLDSGGYFDVFVVIGDTTIGNLNNNPGQLQEYDPSQGGWQNIINTGGQISPFATISATSGGECFVLSSDPQLGGYGPFLWEYSQGSGSFVNLVPPISPNSAIADISAAAADNLIVMDTNGQFTQYSVGFFHYKEYYFWRSL